VSSQTQPTSSGTYLHAGVCSAAANSLPNSLVSTGTVCAICQVWGEQLRLLLSNCVQVQHRPHGVHVQVQLRHLWYRQVRCGVSSRTQAHMIRDYLHARVHPAPANSLVSKYYIFGRCGVNSRTQVPMFRDYLSTCLGTSPCAGAPILRSSRAPSRQGHHQNSPKRNLIFS
jgi:hypothetical protein